MAIAYIYLLIIYFFHNKVDKVNVMDDTFYDCIFLCIGILLRMEFVSFSKYDNPLQCI